MKLFNAIAVTGLAALITTFPAAASNDSHSMCEKAADYAGCMKYQNDDNVQEDSLVALRKAMKKVAARLSSGTSLIKASETFQPVTDAMAVVPAAEQNSFAYLEARRATQLFDVTKAAWRTRIENSRWVLNNFGKTIITVERVCSTYQSQVNAYNAAAGSNAVYFSYRINNSFLAGSSCQPSTTQPEIQMYNHTITVLKEGAVDPKVIAAKEAERKRQQELCAMGPWNRYLADNPAMAAWAKSNPKLAEAKKQEIINDPDRKQDCLSTPVSFSQPALEGISWY